MKKIERLLETIWKLCLLKKSLRFLESVKSLLKIDNAGTEAILKTK